MPPNDSADQDDLIEQEPRPINAGPETNPWQSSAAGSDTDSQSFRPYHDDPDEDNYDHAHEDQSLGHNAVAAHGNNAALENDPERGQTFGGNVDAPSTANRLRHALPRLPVWMRQSSSASRKACSPASLPNAFRAIVAWSKGPDPPRIYSIKPWPSFLQHLPQRLVQKALPRKWHRGLALALTLGAWLVIFVVVIAHSATSGHIKGYGTPSGIWCGQSFWSGTNECGINGDDCRPFADAVFAFRCSAQCGSMIIHDPMTVGPTIVNYKPFVVGGKQNTTGEFVYRADSFICQAAVHAGIVSNSAGGCGVLQLRSQQTSFVGEKRHGVTSIGFDAPFPKSYTFLQDVDSDCGVVDMRWPLLGVTLTFTILLSLFVSSTAVFVAVEFTLLFVHVGLVSDPPNISDYPGRISVLVGRMLPAAFVVALLYRTTLRRTLTGLAAAPFDRTILWLGGAWIGALNNYTFDWIPISRLTPRDLVAQPGGVITLIGLVLLIVACAVGQVLAYRREGRLRRYLVIYGCLALALLIGVALPHLHLRIHHYILALLLLPGTSLQTRPSLFYQGLLLGLFINGIARWGFDPVLQTATALFSGGPQQTLRPVVNATVVAAGGLKRSSILRMQWPSPPTPYDGLRIVVNDVDRYNWYLDQGPRTFEWERDFSSRDALQSNHDTRQALQSDNSTRDALQSSTPSSHQHPDYVRFAWLQGPQAADYTDPGIWHVDGHWWNGTGADRSNASAAFRV